VVVPQRRFENQQRQPNKGLLPLLLLLLLQGMSKRDQSLTKIRRSVFCDERFLPPHSRPPFAPSCGRLNDHDYYYYYTKRRLILLNNNNNNNNDCDHSTTTTIIMPNTTQSAMYRLDSPIVRPKRSHHSWDTQCPKKEAVLPTHQWSDEAISAAREQISLNPVPLELLLLLLLLLVQTQTQIQSFNLQLWATRGWTLPR
jgi:hypothetical protein